MAANMFSWTTRLGTRLFRSNSGCSRISLSARDPKPAGSFYMLTLGLQQLSEGGQVWADLV
jgi:hypothetical protein